MHYTKGYLVAFKEEDLWYLCRCEKTKELSIKLMVNIFRICLLKLYVKDFQHEYFYYKYMHIQNL